MPHTHLWEFHFVCINEKTVYDPSIGVPMSIEEYTPYLFPQQKINYIECSDDVFTLLIDDREIAYARGV